MCDVLYPCLSTPHGKPNRLGQLCFKRISLSTNGGAKRHLLKKWMRLKVSPSHSNTAYLQQEKGTKAEKGDGFLLFPTIFWGGTSIGKDSFHFSTTTLMCSGITLFSSVAVYIKIASTRRKWIAAARISHLSCFKCRKCFPFLYNLRLIAYLRKYEGDKINDTNADSNFSPRRPLIVIYTYYTYRIKLAARAQNQKSRTGNGMLCAWKKGEKNLEYAYTYHNYPLSAPSYTHNTQSHWWWLTNSYLLLPLNFRPRAEGVHAASPQSKDGPPLHT